MAHDTFPDIDRAQEADTWSNVHNGSTFNAANEGQNETLTMPPEAMVVEGIQRVGLGTS